MTGLGQLAAIAERQLSAVFVQDGQINTMSVKSFDCAAAFPGRAAAWTVSKVEGTDLVTSW